VLDAIAQVYRVEAETEGMSAQERLECHQARSGPVMAELREWVEEEFLACGFFRAEARADRLISSFFNLLGSSFKTRPTSEGG
jgi:hypothetical protein